MQLVVYSGLPETTDLEDSNSLNTKIELLETEIVELQGNIVEAQNAITNFQSCMVEDHTELVAESRRLEAQILDLEQDLIDLSRRKTNVSVERDELDDFAEGTEETVLDSISTQISLRKTCKKLYRKIAMLTHPDRTKSKRRREMFKEAKEAYRALDLARLMAMYEELTSGSSDLDKNEVSTLLSKLMDRFNNLLVQAKELRIQWKALRDSDDYMLAMLYASAPGITSDNFRLYMLQQIEALRMKYNFMKSTYDLQSNRQ